MSYFNKFLRVPYQNHVSHPPSPRKQRSQSLDVEALKRSGIQLMQQVHFFDGLFTSIC